MACGLYLARGAHRAPGRARNLVVGQAGLGPVMSLGINGCVNSHAVIAAYPAGASSRPVKFDTTGIKAVYTVYKYM